MVELEDEVVEEECSVETEDSGSTELDEELETALSPLEPVPL